jgi:hypothetical protein
MPRDLLADKTLESMPQLSREPAAASPQSEGPNPYGTSLVLVEDRFKNVANSNIHPFSSLLSVDDLDDCDWLEHAAFDPIEAASREKVSQSQLISVSSSKISTTCASLSSFSYHVCGYVMASIALISMCRVTSSNIAAYARTMPLPRNHPMIAATPSPTASHVALVTASPLRYMAKRI